MTEPTNLPANPDNKNEWEAALIAAGYITAAMAGRDINRIKVQGANFVFEDEIIATYNAMTKEPAMIVQLLGPPMQYQGMWFDKDGTLANAVGRPHIAGKFCKSHFDKPDEARKYAEDQTSCDTCPVNPFRPYDSLPPEAIAQSGSSKCSWRGEVEFRVLHQNDDGTLSALDETIYTMSLPTTAMIEFVGSNSRNSNQLAGSVSDENFMVKLARLGHTKWGDAGIMQARTALELGGVIAEIRNLPAANKERNYNYNVLSFTPIDILEITEQPALPDTSDSTPEPEAEAAPAKPRASRKAKATADVSDEEAVPF